MEDPYAVLGVPPDATWAEVCSARRRLAKALHPDRSGPAGDHDGGPMALVNRAFDEVRAARARAGEPSTPVDATVEQEETGVAFSVGALPVDAFEALLMAAVDLGDVVQLDEPYLLGVLVDHPGPCHCIFELAPEAGGTLVTMDVAPRPFGDCPPPVVVRDAFVEEIRRQGADHV